VTDPESCWSQLDRALQLALAPLAHQAPVVLYSGGIDSGLLAWELRHAPGASLYTIGTLGASDLAAARGNAADLGLPWTGHPLEDPELEDVTRRSEATLQEVPGPRRGIFVALAAAFATAPSGPLVCGQGADELFLGYAHYRGLAPAEAADRAASDLALLLEADWPRTRQLAAEWGREVQAPYLDERFRAAVAEIPLAERLPERGVKGSMRAWARHRGLPEAIAQRPKRALQYGSGVDRWLRRRTPARSPA